MPRATTEKVPTATGKFDFPSRSGKTQEARAKDTGVVKVEAKEAKAMICMAFEQRHRPIGRVAMDSTFACSTMTSAAEEVAMLDQTARRHTCATFWLTGNPDGSPVTEIIAGSSMFNAGACPNELLLQKKI